MQIFVFVHLLKCHHLTIDRCHHSILGVTLEVTTRAAEEIHYQEVENRGDGYSDYWHHPILKAEIERNIDCKQHYEQCQ